MSKQDKQKIKIHFIGIGGIGMSGLALLYADLGFAISGSDLSSSPATEMLLARKIRVKIGHQGRQNIPQGISRVIYNLAIPRDNPELVAARKKGIPCLSYPEAVGALTRDYQTICIAGTHGKTTTTALVGLILKAAGKDPTILVGSFLKELKANACLGSGQYFVLEADEYKRAFLNYHPQILVITNIEAEHLDYYQDYQDVFSAFADLVRRLPPKGVLVVPQKLLQKLSRPGIKCLDYQVGPREKIAKCLQIPGKHNIENALAAFSVARHLDIAPKIIWTVFKKYQGAWRRFEIVHAQKITVIDDYGHHPTEIIATLQGAREQYPTKRILCIFQPHQYKRTKKLFANFAKAFSLADKIIITKIFRVQGRDQVPETEIVKLSRDLACRIKAGGQEAIFLETFSKILKYLQRELKKNDVLIAMGAGDINRLTPKIIAQIKKPTA